MWQGYWRRWCDWRDLTRRRWEVAAALVGAYRQFHLATGGYFVPHRICRWRARMLVQGHTWWSGWASGVTHSLHYLSVADVAVLWHLPQGEDLPDLGQVARTRARTRLAPTAVTHEGYPLGTSTHAGRTVPVRFPYSALTRNLIAIAKSGKGKSTLLLALAQATLADTTSGLFLLDPHGDLVDALAGLIPAERRDQVILVDLADTERPIGINPLDVTVYPDRDVVVSQLISIFSAIWEKTWGSRMEAAFEMALKTLYEVNRSIVAADAQQGPDNQHTLLDVGPVLSVQPFRRSLMQQVTDPLVRAFWSEHYELKTVREKQEMISPVLTKMNKFAASLVARRIVGQPRTTVNFAHAVRAGQIILIRTAKGTVGEDVAAIVGASLIGLVGATMLAQASLPPDQRQRLRIIVDEFQTLPGVPWGTFLSELRKYQASFALATQALAHLDKIDPALRPTVFANIDQIVAFALSAEDGRILERELDGVVDTTDLINLDDFVAYAKLNVAGQRLPLFSLRLLPPAIPDPTVAAQIRASCRARYGVAAAQVDVLIAQALQRHLQYVEIADEEAARRATKKSGGNRPPATPTPTSHQPSQPLPIAATPTPLSRKPTRRAGAATRKAKWGGTDPELVQGQILTSATLIDDEDELSPEEGCAGEDEEEDEA